MLRLLKISGRSLEPEFLPGEFILVARFPFVRSRPQPGDVVVFRHPQHGLLVKKVERVLPGSGELFVVGLHPASIDSRQFGPLPRQNLVGTVIWHIRRPLS